MSATVGSNVQLIVPLEPDNASARKKVEEEIEEHAKAITMLKHRLNTMTTISRLPGELLSEIFVCFARDCFRGCTDHKTHVSYHSYPRGIPEWVRVAHVCHAWREIALSTPRLWSFILVVQRSIAEQLLVRSKKAPLSVVVSHVGYNADRKKFLETIFSEEMCRMRELFISGPSSHVYELCAKLTKPANALHTLALSDSGDNYTSNNSDLIPQNLCNEQFPHLRCLEIRRLAIRWDNPLLCSALTNLVVVQNSYRDTMGTFEQFISALESMSGLQTVELGNAIPPTPPSSAHLQPPSRTITFPHLRDIYLSGLTIDCANFLRHLSLGAGIHLRLSCREETAMQDLVLGIKGALAHSSPWRTVELARRHGSEITLRAWNTDVNFTDSFQIVEPAPFTFELSGRVIVSNEVHRFLFGQPSMFTDTETFVVDGYADWQWKDTFFVLSNLREIVVLRHAPESMLDALSSRLKVQKKRGRSIAFPQLEVLRFYDVRLASPDYDEDEEYFDQLIDCMIFRCNHQHPVQELHITECRNIIDEDVARLEEVVPEVVWDEVVDIEEEEDEEDEDEEEYSDEEDYNPFEEEMYYDPDFDDPYAMW